LSDNRIGCRLFDSASSEPDWRRALALQLSQKKMRTLRVAAQAYKVDVGKTFL